MASQNLSEFNIKSASSRIDYRSRCVTERFSTNQYYYPKSIARDRSNRVLLTILGIIIFLFVFLLFNNCILNFRILTYLIFFRFFIEIIYRLVLLAEEKNHLVSRYNGDVLTLLKNVFSFDRVALFLIVIDCLCVVYFLANNSTDGGFADKITPLELCAIIALMVFIEKLVYWGPRSLDDSMWILRNNGLDYGSGMAYSYFHGYLKLILPETGTEEKNLIELMDIYESKQGVKFECKKLIILMPKSLNCHVHLNSHSPTIIDNGTCLDTIIKDVASVRKRVYKNSVYKLQLNENNRRMYVVAEYATPLKTFRDVTLHSGQHSENYKKLQCDILWQFYKTTKHLLEENHLTEFCEIIFYDDMIGSDKFVDVGLIIMQRLKELKKRERLKVD